MFGPIEFLPIVIVVASLIAAVMDLVWGKIFNIFTAPLLIAGLIYSIYFGGVSALGPALLAVLIALIAFGWMFALKFMGGGDVKFLMALGAWGGVQFVLQTAVLSVIFGGIMAVFQLISKKKASDFLVRIYIFTVSFFVRGMEKGALSIDAKSKMPFGVPIAAAAIWTVYSQPLVKWGLWPWH